MISSRTLLGFFVQIDRGVTRDPFFKFNISTPAKIWRVMKFQHFLQKISLFWVFQAILAAP
jgi:hypothetical protein